MINSWKEAFSGVGAELLERIRERQQEYLDDAAFEERVIGIENAISVLLELEVEEEKIIQMLQKYWDLRVSEAKMFIERQKEQR